MNLTRINSMGRVKQWGMAIDEACEEAVLENHSEEEQFNAAARILRAYGWPVTEKDVKQGLRKALDK